jgi:4'-phosphopantetheinyl transferase EntD
VIEAILPATVASAEAFDDPPGATLFPEEEAVVARAVDKRRREFTTARLCARRALAALGVPPAAILPGEQGVPTWPPGVVGTITHSAGYRAAAVARATDVASVGIDAEPHDALPAGVARVVVLPAEAAGLSDLGRAAPTIHWDRLLFCAKEATYKAWFPLARRWLGFDGAEVTLDPAGTFTSRLLVPGPEVGGRPLTSFGGRWRVADGVVVTAVTVPR